MGVIVAWFAPHAIDVMAAHTGVFASAMEHHDQQAM
jgi:hypothetical protein